MPLVGGTYHFVHNYTNQVTDRQTSKDQGTKNTIFDQERLLSEHVMSFWVHFAKAGRNDI